MAQDSKLTAKKESFAQAIAGGMNQSDAYRCAYNTSKMIPSSIHVNASKMASDAKVAQRIAFLRAELASKSLWTREKSVQVLKDIADDAEGRAADKTAAVKELNSMHGFNAPAKVEVFGSTVTRIELVAMRGNS